MIYDPDGHSQMRNGSSTSSGQVDEVDLGPPQVEEMRVSPETAQAKAISEDGLAGLDFLTGRPSGDMRSGQADARGASQHRYRYDS